jgi:Ethanolamine utilization protein EutJ (predicted chaperonin)
MIIYLIAIGLLLIAFISFAILYNQERKQGRNKDLLLLATLSLKVDAIENDKDVIRCLKYRDMLKDVIDMDYRGNITALKEIEKDLKEKSHVTFECSKEKESEKVINEIII